MPVPTPWSPVHCCEPEITALKYRGLCGWERHASVSDKQENSNCAMLGWRCSTLKQVKTSFNFTVHRPESPDHQAQPALPKNLGTRTHSESWTSFFLAVHARQSLQFLSKSLRETSCSLWKVSMVFHDPRLLERHL